MNYAIKFLFIEKLTSIILRKKWVKCDNFCIDALYIAKNYMFLLK